MAQHDMNIANQGFPAFRADLNDALGALVSNSSGATAPSTTFAHQLWVDTAANPSVLKIRNADNDAWITIGEIDQTGDKFNLKCANATISENLTLNAQGDLRFADSDSSNWVAFQAPATVSSNVTWTLPATDGTSGQALTTDGSGTLSWAAGAPDNGYNFRNRIINGDMRIDQRNAGAAVTVNANATFFSVDRFAGLGNGSAGVFTLQQDSSAPVGFVNSIKATVTTIDSSISSENYRVQHKIEGTNVADLGFGTANAKTVTLSFWARSSVTGTFGGAIKNSAQNRSYPFTYSISVADTWEYKTITIAGDTSGTWLTDTGTGIWVSWSLGGDTNNTAGAWVGSNSVGATGQTQLISTLNATWYITGVQLEVGSVATPFERLDYGRQLIQCQRYYYKNFPALSNSGLGSSFNADAQFVVVTGFFPVQMRIRPTALEQTGTASDYLVAHRATSTACSSVPAYDGVTNQNLYTVVFAVSSGLTAGDGSQARTNSTSGFLAWSAEL